MKCPKCKNGTEGALNRKGQLVFICSVCPDTFYASQMEPAEPCELDRSATIQNEKLQAILAWLDEYHMAYKDAKRWRRELEKFLTSIL